MFQYSSKTVFANWPEQVKLLLLIALGVLAVLCRDLTSELLLLAFVFVLLLAANYRHFLILLLYLLPFFVVVNAIFIFAFPQAEGLYYNLLIGDIRVMVIFLSFAFFSHTTDIFALLKTLKKWRLPKSVYLSLYIALRFLPQLEKDFHEIKDLNKLKGITPKKPFSFIKATLLPLLYTLFERAEELSIAYYLREKNRPKEIIKI